MLRNADSLLAERGLAGRRFIALAPGAGFGSAKLWPATHYGMLARWIAGALGLATVLFLRGRGRSRVPSVTADHRALPGGHSSLRDLTERA